MNRVIIALVLVVAFMAVTVTAWAGVYPADSWPRKLSQAVFANGKLYWIGGRAARGDNQVDNDPLYPEPGLTIGKTYFENRLSGVSIYDPINWEWVEGLMKMFGEHGFPKMLKYTVTRDNFDFLPVVLASLPLTGMEWFQIKPYNRVEDVLIDSQYELLPWQVLEMSNLVLNFRKANPGIKVDMLPLCYEFLLSDLPIGSLSHCNCGKGERGYLVIGPTGDIRICGAYPKPIGNANKDSISELWETHPLLLEVRGLANREKPEECKGCKHWDKCAATDCHSATFAKFGDFTHGNPQCPYLSTKRLMT